MATFRFCTGTPVTSLPRKATAPEVGGSRPAMSCISVVLPERVVPRRMLKLPSSKTRFVSWICTSAPTRFDTLFSSSDMAVNACSSRSRDYHRFRTPGARGERTPEGGRREGDLALLALVLGPPLDELVIGDRLAWRLLVVELGPRSVVLAQPLRRIALLVKPGSAVVVD